MNDTNRASGSSELDSAISAWKRHSGGQESLSDVARSRILARAADSSRPAPSLMTLFFPLKRLVLAGVLPLFLLTALIGYLTHQGLVGLQRPDFPPISASKTHDGEVIFRIANGTRAHKVYLSTAPDRFDNAPAFTTRDGAFRDRLNGGPDLVFYRID